MVESRSLQRRLFMAVDIALLTFLAGLCLFPTVHVLALSLSSRHAVDAGRVVAWPVDFHLLNYIVIFKYTPEFRTALTVSVLRSCVGTLVNLLLICLTAYPLSREARELRGRNAIMWLFVFPMLFSGGLIPLYILVKRLGLYNTFWVYILPGALPLWSVIILMNFFRSMPASLYEAAMLDGASHPRILFQIFVPLSLPSIATLTLFSLVGHWNSWFDGLIFIENTWKLPLQTLLQKLITQSQQLSSAAIGEDLTVIQRISDRSLIAGQIFITMFPILCVYPFLQKYFVKGLTLGSVKE